MNTLQIAADIIFGGWFVVTAFALWRFYFKD